MQGAKALDVATCMYYTGIDPFSKQEVYVARNLRDRKLQRALLQFFKPDNYFEVRKVMGDNYISLPPTTRFPDSF
jgi:radical SAM superfamily enzyme YgiQ (UPF0313 family)